MSDDVSVLHVELTRSRLVASIGELNELLYRSAYSTLMRESRDCSMSLLSHRGDVLVDPPGTFHGASYHYLIRRLLERYGESLAAGDVFMSNHPYDAGIPHTPDLGIVVPAFLDGRLVGFSASIAHKSDFGGSVIGSASMSATELHQEGLLVPLIRVATADDGDLDPALMAIIEANVRTPDLFFGDMRAQLGVTRLGAQRLVDLARRAGIDTLHSCFDEMLDQGERALRSAVTAWQDGEATAVGYMDNDGISDVPVKISVTVRVVGDHVIVDLSGTDDQARGAVNMTRVYSDSAVFYSLISCAIPDFGFNDGLRRVVTIRRRHGSLVDPAPPAPVGAATAIQHRLTDLCFDALGQLVPGAASAHSGGSGGTVGIAWSVSGERSFQYEVLGTAMGALHDADGVSGVCAYSTNLAVTPIEILESQYPVRITRFELITDSGGAGRYRGGLSYRREYEALAPALVRRRAERGRFPGQGIAGGQHGSLGRVTIRRATGEVESVPVAGQYHLAPHDVFLVEGSGAGGYGDPLERPIAEVMSDVRSGLVSRGAAESSYGIHFDESGPDPVATELSRVKKSRR